MEVLFSNFLDISWKQVVMWLIGGLLIFLAIKKKYGAVAAFANGLRYDSCQFAGC